MMRGEWLEVTQSIWSLPMLCNHLLSIGSQYFASSVSELRQVTGPSKPARGYQPPANARAVPHVREGQYGTDLDRSASACRDPLSVSNIYGSGLGEADVGALCK